MPPPDPELCAWTLQRASGGLFAHGPLVPSQEAGPLGGRLHPRVREEWQRVLAEYFGPLNMTAEQVEHTLARLGGYIQRSGEVVTLQTLCKWSGERLYDLIARALVPASAAAPKAATQEAPRRPAEWRQPEQRVDSPAFRPLERDRSGTGPKPLSVADHFLSSGVPPLPAELADRGREWAKSIGLRVAG